MDQEMQDLIDHFEIVCRSDMDKGESMTSFPPEDILDIFAAFRLEIIKAGGRNA